MHHFPLEEITGVTVMLRQMLELVPAIAEGAQVAYLHYPAGGGVGAFEGDLAAAGTETTAVVAVNQHIEVGWECSVALARWCRIRALPLWNHVQDYWPHHREPLQQLVTEGVRLLAASPFLAQALAADGFDSEPLPMGAQVDLPVAHGPPQRLVGCLGRLVPRKRFSEVVRAFVGAGLDRSARLQMILIRSRTFSSEQDAEQLRLVEVERRAARREAAVEIRHEPLVPPDYTIYAAYVCASGYEGFSMTPYEAAWSGCPPLVSDIPPHRRMAEALFGGQAGDFLFPVGETKALGRLLVDELATGRRRALLAARQSALRAQIAADFSIQTTARAFAELLRRA